MAEPKASTLAKRATSLRQLANWLEVQGRSLADVDEADIARYLWCPAAASEPVSVSTGAVEALGFAKRAFGFSNLDGALRSGRVRGVLFNVVSGRAASSSGAPYSCAAMLVLDSGSITPQQTAAPTRTCPESVLNRSSSATKRGSRCSSRHQRSVAARLMAKSSKRSPIVASERQFLPDPSPRCRSHLTPADANEHLKTAREHFHLSTKEARTYSAKHTLLAWLERAGVKEKNRKLLGGHVISRDRTMEGYSRDLLTQPHGQLVYR